MLPQRNIYTGMLSGSNCRKFGTGLFKVLESVESDTIDGSKLSLNNARMVPLTKFDMIDRN
jgi:hypothetical protein